MLEQKMNNSFFIWVYIHNKEYYPFEYIYSYQSVQFVVIVHRDMNHLYYETMILVEDYLSVGVPLPKPVLGGNGPLPLE